MQSHRNTPLSQCYKKNEREKRRAYDQRIREVKHGSFSPLVFSTAGGMGPSASVVYKRIASMLAQKYDQAYSKTLHWVCCKLSYCTAAFSFINVPERSTLNCSPPSSFSKNHGPCLSGRLDPPSIKTYPAITALLPFNTILFLYHFVSHAQLYTFQI